MKNRPESCSLIHVLTPPPTITNLGVRADDDEAFIFAELQRIFAGLWFVDETGDFVRLNDLSLTPAPIEEIYILEANPRNYEFMLNARRTLVHLAVIRKGNEKGLTKKDIESEGVLKMCRFSFELKKVSDGATAYIGFGRKMVSDTASACFFQISNQPFLTGTH